MLPYPSPPNPLQPLSCQAWYDTFQVTLYIPYCCPSPSRSLENPVIKKVFISQLAQDVILIQNIGVRNELTNMYTQYLHKIVMYH